jgi:hypothetical protein
MGKGAAKRLMQAEMNEAKAAEAAAKRQMIDEVVQEDSPKSSFDDDDDETVIDTEAPVKRKGKDISSLQEREAKRQRLEAKNAEGGEDTGNKKPAAKDTSEEAEDEEEEIQAPVLRPARASMPYHLSTLARSAKISEIYQEWKYGQLGADPLKDVNAETIQAWSANPEKQREYRTRLYYSYYSLYPASYQFLWIQFLPPLIQSLEFSYSAFNLPSVMQKNTLPSNLMGFVELRKI